MERALKVLAVVLAFFVIPVQLLAEDFDVFDVLLIVAIWGIVIIELRWPRGDMPTVRVYPHAPADIWSLPRRVQLRVPDRADPYIPGTKSTAWVLADPYLTLGARNWIGHVLELIQESRLGAAKAQFPFVIEGEVNGIQVDVAAIGPNHFVVRVRGHEFEVWMLGDLVERVEFKSIPQPR